MTESTTGASRGFTLVELMVSVGIIGLLASVAVSQFSRSQLRSKAAERASIMEAIGTGVNDVVMQRDGQAQRVPGDLFAGGWNPATAPTSTKRAFDWTLTGWSTLPMVVQGNTYYSYTFVAADPAPRGTNVTMTILAEGDLDADGVSSWKQLNYVATGYAFQLVSEIPVRGAEDWQTYRTF
jgi:prepilin-type N-terminal cleavage/methylation domain-containing protein